ncbi:hypothetical protein BGZ68_003099, partial [Mortierella alpina]
MVGWDAKGVYNVQRGASLAGNSGSTSAAAPNEFYQFKYNFQPESVDKSRPGGLVGNGETFELEFAGSGGSTAAAADQGHTTVINGAGNGGGETYSWTSTERTSRAVDCLLIFDEETQTFTLERQHSAFSFIQNRKNKESKQQVLHLPQSKYDPNATAVSPIPSSTANTPVLPSTKHDSGKKESQSSQRSKPTPATAPASHGIEGTSSTGEAQPSQDLDEDNYDLLMDIENAMNDIEDDDMQGGEEGDDEDDDEDMLEEVVLSPSIATASTPAAASSTPILPPSSTAKAPALVPSTKPASVRKPIVKPKMPVPPEQRAAAAAAAAAAKASSTGAPSAQGPISVSASGLPPKPRGMPGSAPRRRKVSTSGSESGSGSSSSGSGSSSGSSSSSSSSGSGSDSDSGSGSGSDSDSGSNGRGNGAKRVKRTQAQTNRPPYQQGAPIGLGLSTPVGDTSFGTNNSVLGASVSHMGGGSTSLTSTPKNPSISNMPKAGASVSVGGTPRAGGATKVGVAMPIPPHERMLKQQQQQQEQPRVRKPSSPGTEAGLSDDDFVDFLEGQIM